MRLPVSKLEFFCDIAGRPVQIGNGAFSRVYLTRVLPGGDVAVKVTRLSPGTDSGKVWREVALMRQCSHDRILPLLGVAIKGDLLLMALKFMPGGSLHKAMLSDVQRTLRWDIRGQRVAQDIAEGLAYLHQQHILHSDLSSSNVLLNADLRACIADLGLSQSLKSRAHTAAGLTARYAAPEQMLGERCTLAADLFALGVLLIELTTGQVGTKRGDWRLPQVPQECSQAVLCLIEDCISLDPHRRPTAAEALQRLQAAAVISDDGG